MKGLDLIREWEGEVERLFHLEVALAGIVKSLQEKWVHQKWTRDKLEARKIAERVPWHLITLLHHLLPSVCTLCGARIVG